MMNLSEGGLAVNTAASFKTGARVKTQFTLPEEPTAFDIDADVSWCDDKGSVGLQFVSVLPEQKLVLQLWLSHRIEQGLPQHVTQLFQTAH